MPEQLPTRVAGDVLQSLALLLAPVVAHIGHIVVERHRRRERRHELRRQLLDEVQRTDWLDAVVEAGLVSADGGRIVGGTAPRSVYDANRERLGLLTPAELQALSAYYDTLDTAEYRLTDFRTAEGGAKSAAEYDLRTRILPALAERRRTAERTLREHTHR